MTENRRTLIIDDDLLSCQLLAEVLADVGIDAEWTTNAMKGYELATQQPYVFILCDVCMPGMSGIELTMRLKQINPAIKILLISGFADDSLVETARSLETPLLSKPFLPKQLLATVQNLLQS